MNSYKTPLLFALLSLTTSSKAMQTAAMIKASQDIGKKNQVITFNNHTDDATIHLNGEHGMCFGPRCTGCKMDNVITIIIKAQGTIKSTYSIDSEVTSVDLTKDEETDEYILNIK